eukprot:scaffold1352_cov261-Pinguiococcus_pyrenoidosus.AAC.10
MGKVRLAPAEGLLRFGGGAFHMLGRDPTSPDPTWRIDACRRMYGHSTESSGQRDSAGWNSTAALCPDEA